MLWDAPFVEAFGPDAQDSAETRCPAKRYEPAREKVHALLIEIDALARETLDAIARRSKQLDIDVTACRTLEEAEAALKQVRFDVVYLDYWLGSETSVPFIHALDSQHGPPCVVLTDLDEPDIRRIAFRAGAQAFLSKESLNTQALEGVTLAVLRPQMKAHAAA
jgi:DNA-binding NarL/FixJ family response regulator